MRNIGPVLLMGCVGLFACGGGYEGPYGGGSGGSGGGAGSEGCTSQNCAGCCLNNVCQPGSTAAACGKNAATCSACGSGQICKVNQTCGVDPESEWVVQPVSATIRSTGSDGSAWDALGGAPDPYCTLYCPATATSATSSTAYQDDVFMVTWSTGGCTMKAKDLMSIGFKLGVYDDDVSDDDVVASPGTLIPSEAELLLGRMTGIHNDSTLTTLTVELRRQ